MVNSIQNVWVMNIATGMSNKPKLQNLVLVICDELMQFYIGCWSSTRSEGWGVVVFIGGIIKREDI